MIHKPRLRHLGRALAFAALFSTGAAQGVFGQAAVKPKTVPGEIILYMQPGTDKNVVLALAAKVNPASVTPLLLQDCYVLELPAARANEVDTVSAVTTLKMDPNVRWVNASPLHVATQTSAAPKLTPNDPRFPEQWALPLIKMPQAWVLQKGALNVNLAWIDSGFEPTHEDAMGQFLAGSYDFGNNDSDITADGVGGEPNHGIGTSGIAIARTDNSKGIAGICWENIKVLALKIQPKGSPDFSTPAILNSYAYILKNKDLYHIVAVNMSYGGGGDPADVNNPEYVATKALADAGVLMVASAGNSGAPADGNPIELPSRYPHVISVSAVDRNGKLAGYSSYGKVEIAAPGGDDVDTGIPADGVLSLDVNNTYSFHSGTSNSAPHVTAVLGLLMSVPGVTTAQAKQAMYDTANRSGLALTTLPDPKYGYGLLDAYAALLKVSISVVIDDPIGINANGLSTDPSGLPPPPTETLKPTFRFKISNVPLDSLSITIDPGTPQAFVVPASLLQNSVESGITSGVNPQYVITFRHQFDPTGPTNHKVVISGTNPTTGVSASDSRTFTIIPHLLPGGQSLISIPYYESADDAPAPKSPGIRASGAQRNADELLGPDALLSRFLYVLDPADGTYKLKYAQYKTDKTDPTLLNQDASLLPTSFVPTPDSSNVTPATAPLGVGYFLDAKGPISVVTNGQSFDTTAFRLPLREGWNMIGNPYRFAIPFDGLVFDTLAGTRLTAEAAADQNLILPFIYRFVNGQYQFERLPAGNLQAWEGQWIYVVPHHAVPSKDVSLTLITTPVAVSGFAGRSAKSTRAVATQPVSLSAPPRLGGSGGWTMQLEASGKDLHDGYNFVGVTRSAAISSKSLVPKPPHPSPYVTLGMTRQDGKGAVYAQDLQTAGGVKTWDIVVMTDQPNTDITLRWPNMSTVPRNYRLTLQDKATGQDIDLRTQAAYQFNSGHDAATRAFTLTAHPTNSGGRAVLTNINVNPPRNVGGRAAGAYQIGYTVSQDARVEVAILGYNGQTLAQIGSTRAVTSGDNHQVWNGKDTKGATVPAGTYLLQLKAVTTDGTVSREIRPLTVSGR
jgi:hypothetical protein